MCGIFGLMGKHEVSFDPVGISEKLKHRGPDDEGWMVIDTYTGKCLEARGDDTVESYKHLPHVKELVGIGNAYLLNRRLSILDLSPNGHQPMKFDSLLIVFNGEIYNYKEIGETLRKEGYIFETQTDTEVLLKSFHKWGLDLFNKLNGMFAFAIYDLKTKKLFLARDRFGKKPVYYTFSDRYFAFSSEIKALMELPFVGKSFNEREVIRYLIWSENEVEESTIFEGIYKLPPSHYMVFDLNRWEILKRRYYRIAFYDQTVSFDYAKEKFLYLLKSAIKLRFRSDVKVGTSLSGGLDSSSIVYIASSLNVASNSYVSFSAVHPDFPELDESKYIDIVVRDTGIENYRIAPNEAFVKENLRKFIYHQEEPVSTLNPFSQFAVYSLPRKYDVIVLLDGQGGDEILAGYLRYVPYYLKELLLSFRISDFLREMYAFRKTNLNYREMLLRFVGIDSYHSLFFILKGRQIFKKLPNYVPPPGNIRKKFNNLKEKLLVDVEENIPVLLRYADKNSSAFSIEVRNPYLDYRLVEFMISLPVSFKIHDGLTKYIARKAFESFMNREIVYRRDKLGFPFPQSRLVPKEEYSSLIRSSYILKHLNTRSPEDVSYPIFWRLLNIALIEEVFHL